MKQVYKIIAMFVVVLSLGTLITGCGCSSSDAPKEKSNLKTEMTVVEDAAQKLVGTWKFDGEGDYTYTFNDNGTGKYEYTGAETDFTYTIDGNLIAFLYNGASTTNTVAFTIKDDTLIIQDSGYESSYKRV